MADRLIFLNTVRDGVSVERAEQFLRTRDIPVATEWVPSILAYHVTRVHNRLFDDAGTAPPYHFVDFVEVSSVEDYYRDIAALEGTPHWTDFDREWNEIFVGTPLYATTLDTPDPTRPDGAPA